MRVSGFPDLRIRRVVLPDDEEVLWSFARDAHEREGWSTRRTAEACPGGPMQRLMVKRLVD